MSLVILPQMQILMMLFPLSHYIPHLQLITFLLIIHTTIPSNLDIQKSQRTSRPPKYLKDYHCNSNSQTDHLITHSPNHIGHSDPQRHLVLNISSQFEPQFFHQAAQFP